MVMTLDLYERVIDFNNLYEAYLESRKGKRWKNATARFSMHALSYIWHLHEELKSGTYRITHEDYNVFLIHEPKERVIKSIPFAHKIVQRSICDNALEPIFERTFLYDNYASRKGKGTHAALDRTRDFLRAHYRKYGIDGYILKCDVEKYFDSINHENLKRMYRTYITDERLLWLLDMIVDSTPGDGLPIGNQTSQLFSLLYLNAMDHFIKRYLRIKWYVRYMDDFVLMCPDKEYLQYAKKEIELFLSDIGLSLNEKSHVFPIKNGVNFLGFYMYVTDAGKVISKLRRESKEKMRRKLKKFHEMYKKGEITKEQIMQSWESWKGHASHGNTYNLIKKFEKQYFLPIFEEDDKWQKS